MPRRTTKDQPRGWLEDVSNDSKTKRDRRFGRVHDPDWKTLPGDADISMRAALETAKYQHVLARQMHARMRDAGLTVKETAEICGMSDATLRRFLNGTNHPTIYDLHRFALAVGVPFLGGYPRRGDTSLTDAG